MAEIGPTVPATPVDFLSVMLICLLQSYTSAFMMDPRGHGLSISAGGRGRGMEGDTFSWPALASH